MREIKIGNSGLFAQVDDDIFEYLNQFGWNKTKGKTTVYATRDIWEHNKRIHRYYMHREIMGFPENMQVDHIDHNGLNNQKINLRICSNTENARNSTSARNATSKYLGVCITYTKKGTLRWKSTIMYNRKSIWIGAFDTEIDAAIAYDKKAIGLFGEFANLNFKDNVCS